MGMTTAEPVLRKNYIASLAELLGLTPHAIEVRIARGVLPKPPGHRKFSRVLRPRLCSPPFLATR